MEQEEPIMLTVIGCAVGLVVIGLAKVWWEVIG
jgi:hypothetical protein